MKLKRTLNSKNFYLLTSFVFLCVCINLYSGELIYGYTIVSPPTITITTPTGGSTYSTTSGKLNIAGNASPSSEGSSCVVTWSNDRGGNGTASGSSSWSVSGINLQVGQNIITATVTDDKYDNKSIRLTVFFTPLPDISIKAPVSGQRLGEQVFTITGTASNISQLGSVLYQLNSDVWKKAVGTTSWSATVNLTPGTNTIRAYAVDTSGNASVTNTLSFDYVVTNQLKVRAIGLGNLNPNYSNAWLEVGRTYTITATPATYFAFTNWMISTNWAGGAKALGSTLRFTMQPNLTLEAHFAETTAPKITVKTPKTTNPLVKLTGTASDVWGVASVWYQLNGGTWNLATTTDGWKNWTATLPLASGVNQINAYSVNLGGNKSPIKSLNVNSKATFKLQLGLAPVNPTTNDGMNFSLQVTPGLSGTIQVSSDLVNWQTLTNFVGSNSTINFHDQATKNFSQRFYRAVMPEP